MSNSEFQVLPTQDVFIHYLFTSADSEGILLSFVNAVLADAGRPLVEKIRIANTFDPQRFKGDKWCINDIKAIDKDGKVYEIEIQTLNQRSFKNRILYYWSREYSNQLSKGDDYRELNPVIVIAVTRFLLFPELKKLHNEFYITCLQNPNYILTDDLQLHFIELADEKWNNLAKMSPALCDWLDFLANANQKTEEEMEILLKKDKNKGVQEAYEKYQSFCQSPDLRRIAEDRWLSELLKRTLLGEAEERGMEKGMEKGLQKGRQEGLQEGRQEGLQEGRQEGLQEGLEKGIQKGKKEGKKEGIQEGQRKSLLAVLRTRFGEIPEEVLRKIDSQEKDWGELLTLGITCDTLEEFCGYWK